MERHGTQLLSLVQYKRKVCHCFRCGDCPAGYTGDGKTCADVDECEEEVCDHICINTPGAFVCDCRTGYALNEDGSTCDGIQSSGLSQNLQYLLRLLSSYMFIKQK